MPDLTQRLVLYVDRDIDDPTQIAFAIAPCGVPSDDLGREGIPVIAMPVAEALKIIQLITTEIAKALRAKAKPSPIFASDRDGSE